MASDRARVLIAALIAIGVLVAGALALDWFSFEVSGLMRAGLGLRSITVCDARDVCASLEMKHVVGLYPTFAMLAMWATLAFAAVVALQAGLRLIGGAAAESLTTPGYALGVGAMGLAVAAAYLFGPEPGKEATAFGTVSAARTWVPLAVIAGDVVGLAALYFATQYGDAAGDAPAPSEAPGPYRTLAAARALPPAAVGGPGAAASGVPVARAAPAAHAAPPSSPGAPAALRGKLAYAVHDAELSRAGIDARLEDGASRLVLWRDVVGAVARRLPAAYDGAPFVDLVSTAGATVRALPWTRLTGEALDAEAARADAAPEDRLRALVRAVLAHCPAAHLDRGTRDFLEGREPAPQLPDLALLAEHDARLA